jgi:hypothetical protein
VATNPEAWVVRLRWLRVKPLEICLGCHKDNVKNVINIIMTAYGNNATR